MKVILDRVLKEGIVIRRGEMIVRMDCEDGSCRMKIILSGSTGRRSRNKEREGEITMRMILTE